MICVVSGHLEVVPNVNVCLLYSPLFVGFTPARLLDITCGRPILKQWSHYRGLFRQDTICGRIFRSSASTGWVYSGRTLYVDEYFEAVMPLSGFTPAGRLGTICGRLCVNAMPLSGCISLPQPESLHTALCHIDWKMSRGQIGGNKPRLANTVRYILI